MCCTWFCCSYFVWHEKQSHVDVLFAFTCCCCPTKIVLCVCWCVCTLPLQSSVKSNTWIIFMIINTTHGSFTNSLCLECFHYICIAAQRVQFICLTCAYSSLTDVEPSVGKRFAFVVCVCACVCEGMTKLFIQDRIKDNI